MRKRKVKKINLTESVAYRPFGSPPVGPWVPPPFS
jgi:hypothetical protein